MSDYFKRKVERNIVQLFHKSDRVNPISTVHSVFETKGLFGPKEIHYRLTNQLGVHQKSFQTMESAIAHSIDVHKRSQQPGAKAHPIVKVASHINALGDAIEDASKDTQLEDHHQVKLLDVTKAYATLVNAFNKHFGHDH